MADDDKDFTFGDVGDDFTSDDGWGALEDDPGAPGQAAGEDFPEAESDPEGSDSVVPPDVEKNQIVEDSVEAGGRRTSPRMILYGLLVIVLSAAGFYYFTTSPLPPEAEKKPAPASQTLAMPERPEPVPISDQTPATAAPAASDAAGATPVAVPKGTLREVMPSEPAAAVVEKQPPPPASVAAASPPATSAPVAGPEKAPVKVPAAAKKTAAGTSPPKGGFYAIQAGAYADPANRDEALGKIRQLGFETKVVSIQKKMPVIRLLIGVYAPDEGRKKVLELAKTIPSAFTLRQGKQIAVYAGSFTAPEKAKEFVAELSTKGIRITEQKAEVELTLSRVFFGRFTDQAAAAAARDQAKAVGLEADIVRQP